MKRILSVFLGIALVLSMLAGGLAFAELDSPITIDQTTADTDPTGTARITISDSTGDQPEMAIGSPNGVEVDKVWVTVDDQGGQPSAWVGASEEKGSSASSMVSNPSEGIDVTVNADVNRISVQENAHYNGNISNSTAVDMTVQGDVSGEGLTSPAVDIGTEATENAQNSGSINVDIKGKAEIQNSNNPAVGAYSSAGSSGNQNGSAVNSSTITVNVDQDVKANVTSADYPYAYAVRARSEAEANWLTENKNIATATNDSEIYVTVGGNASATAVSTSDVQGHSHAYAVAAGTEAYAGSNGTAKNTSEVTVIVKGNAEATAVSNGQTAEAYAISANGAEKMGNAENGSSVTVTVNGNAEATAKTSKDNTGSSATGVYARGATVNVDKNVTATGEKAKAIGIDAWNAAVNIGGDVTATSDKDSTAVKVGGGAEVTVGGNVQSSGDAITVTVSTENGAEKSTVVVEGTVSAGDSTLLLDVGNAADADVDAVVKNLPEIIVQTISPDADIVVTAPNMGDDSKGKITDEMFAQISYIVTTNDMDTAKVSIVGTDTRTVGDTTYVVAYENDTITVKNIGDGKIVGVQVGGENPIAQVQDNGDGSWTITVCRGGNLDINVTYEDAKQEEPEVQPVNITVTPSTGDVFTGPMLLTLGSGENINVLTVNMVYINKTDILVSTFQNFANQGYDTVQIQTAGGIYSITMAELLSLANGGSLITFVIRGDLLEVYVDWQLVMTLALTRTSV